MLEKTAHRQPKKTAIITKDEELSFAALNERVHALAANLQQKELAKAIASEFCCPIARRFR